MRRKKLAPMDEDRAILSAAFAFRDRAAPPTALTQRLRDLLPATIDDVPLAERKTLGDRVLNEVAGDAAAIQWFATAVDAMKAYGGAKSPVDALIYICPFGDQRWARPSILDDVPNCSAHHVPLQPLSAP